MHWRGNKDPVIKTEMMLQLEDTDILSLFMFSHCFFTSFAFCCVQCDYWLQELMPQLYRGHTGSSSTPRWHISTRPHLARVCSQFLKDKGSIPHSPDQQNTSGTSCFSPSDIVRLHLKLSRSSSGRRSPRTL